MLKDPKGLAVFKIKQPTIYNGIVDKRLNLGELEYIEILTRHFYSIEKWTCNIAVHEYVKRT